MALRWRYDQQGRQSTRRAINAARFVLARDQSDFHQRPLRTRRTLVIERVCVPPRNRFNAPARPGLPHGELQGASNLRTRLPRVIDPPFTLKGPMHELMTAARKNIDRLQARREVIAKEASFAAGLNIDNDVVRMLA